MGAKVLVVEDDEDVRDAVAQFLSLRGYAVIEAEDGAQALERVQSGMPDLILLDMKMPVMNGWQFARAFRDRYDSAAPIVVLTAAQDAERRAEEIAAEGWLSKPFEVAELYAVVQRWAHQASGNAK